MSVQGTGLVIKLSGPLGAGKTSFLKSFAKALGIQNTIISPSFNLHRSYQSNNITLEHWDLYRLTNLDDNLYHSIIEQVMMPGTIVAIEWLDKFNWEFDRQITIDISYLAQPDQDYQSRNIQVKYQND